jgi:hypothetical protein
MEEESPHVYPLGPNWPTNAHPGYGVYFIQDRQLVAHAPLTILSCSTKLPAYTATVGQGSPLHLGVQRRPDFDAAALRSQHADFMVREDLSLTQEFIDRHAISDDPDGFLEELGPHFDGDQIIALEGHPGTLLFGRQDR